MNPISQDDQQLNLPNLEMPLGLRLRRAREAVGLSVGDVATKLRLKAVTVEALEKEDLDVLGAAVYVRGYYNSYARLVGVPTVLVDGLSGSSRQSVPQLQTSTRVSHSRYLFDRYAKRVVYVVLTASIVVPVILLATRDQLPRPGATLTSLDAPTPADPSDPGRVADAAASGASVSVVRDEVGPPARLARSAAETPVIASLGPFYQSAETPAPAAIEPPPATAPGLRLELSGESWVEVLDSDGNRLAHGVFRAGETHDFAFGKVAKVSIGNANAVTVRMNGTETDIAPYRRANVARFTVSSDGSLAPAGG
jgi:cytoskeleton protein RodZ